MHCRNIEPDPIIKKLLQSLHILATRSLEQSNICISILGLFLDTISYYGKIQLPSLFQSLGYKYKENISILEQLLAKLSTVDEDSILHGFHYQDPNYIRLLANVSRFIFPFEKLSSSSSQSMSRRPPNQQPNKISLELISKCAFALNSKFIICKYQRQGSSNNTTVSVKKFGIGDYVIHFVEDNSNLLAIFPKQYSTDLFNNLSFNDPSINYHCGHIIAQCYDLKNIPSSCRICNERLYHQDRLIIKKGLFQLCDKEKCFNCDTKRGLPQYTCRLCKLSKCNTCAKNEEVFECTFCSFFNSKQKPGITENNYGSANQNNIVSNEWHQVGSNPVDPWSKLYPHLGNNPQMPDNNIGSSNQGHMNNMSNFLQQTNQKIPINNTTPIGVINNQPMQNFVINNVESGPRNQNYPNGELNNGVGYKNINSELQVRTNKDVPFTKSWKIAGEAINSAKIADKINSVGDKANNSSVECI